MTFEFHWFLPSNGDGPHLANSGLPRPVGYTVDLRLPTPDYLRSIVRTVESAGFDGILVPTATGFEDPWLATALLATATRTLRFILTFRPGMEAPWPLARKIATLQRVLRGRLDLFPVIGSSIAEQRAIGDFLGHDARYARADALLQWLREGWHCTTRVSRGDERRRDPRDPRDTFASPLLDADDTTYAVHGSNADEEAPPRIFLGGASSSARHVAARHAQTYLLWAEPPDAVRQRLEAFRAEAAEHAFANGTTSSEATVNTSLPKFGLRVHIIARPTAQQAWDRAEELLRGITGQTLVAAQRELGAYESVGQARQSALSRGRMASVRELEVYPNLWAGVGLMRGGAGTALVGDYDQVAALMAQYHALGISVFVLSAHPNLEEASRVGAAVLPRFVDLIAPR